MSWTHVADTGSGPGTAQDLSVNARITLSVGDLVVAYAKWDGADGTVSIDDTGDGGSSTLAIQTHVHHGDNYNGAFGALVVAESGSLLFTLHLPSSRTNVEIVLCQFAPSATPTLDTGPSSGTGASTPVVTGIFSTTGTDELVIAAGCRNSTAGSWSAQDIASAGVDGSATNSNNLVCIWYKAFAAAQSSKTGSATIAAGSWIGDVLAYRIGGGGGTSPSVMADYYRRLR